MHMYFKVSKENLLFFDESVHHENIIKSLGDVWKTKHYWECLTKQYFI